MTESSRFSAPALLEWAAGLFCAAGAAPADARLIADGFLQADLLGFHTHGLALVPLNLGWIEQGLTRIAGEPRILDDRGAVLNVDADYLAGPLTMDWTCRIAVERAQRHGIAALTIRKSQHIGALAPWLLRIAEQGHPVYATVATPEESLVTVAGGKSPLFSTNPFGFAFPAEGEPVLLDMSLAVTAAGRVRMAEREGQRLPGHWLLDSQGQPSDAPADFREGVLLPLGGLDHGHKGSGLLLWSELFAACLGGWGRKDRTGSDDANSIYLVVHDPAGSDALEQVATQAAFVTQLYESVVPRMPGEEPRVPGRHALAERRRALSDGVMLPAPVLEALRQCAAKRGSAFPEPWQA